MKKYSVTLRDGNCCRLLTAFMQQVRDGAEQPGCEPSSGNLRCRLPFGCIFQFTTTPRRTARLKISLSNKGDFGQFVSGCAIPVNGARLW
jgi:hypothetical protein